MVETCTLLIVDDCAEDREVCRRYLLKDPQQSYQILEADSAEDGLSLCQERNCDAILLDFCLPTMNGLEFLDALKQHQPDPVPVILLTGYGAEEVAVEAMKKGVQDYLIKQQLQPDVLQLTVRNAIQHWQSQIQLNKTEQRQRLVNTIALHMRQSLDRQQVLHTAVTQIQQLLECDQVAVYQAQYGETQPPDLIKWQQVTAAGRTRTVSPSSSDLWIETIEAAIHQADPANAAIDPIGWSWETQNKLILPLFLSSTEVTQEQSIQEQRLWGVLVAQHSAVKPWHSDEVEIVRELVTQLGSALQQAEQFSQMQVALEQAQQLNAFKSQMVATVSHEYRNPLTAILAAASTLKLYSEQFDLAQQQHLLATIEDKARFMTRLVEDLLVLEKLELGQMGFRPLPLNILELVADVVEEQRWLAGEQYEIIFRVSGNTKGFWGDSDLLRQILVNLLSNGIKYSPNGGKVELHLSGTTSHLIFSIQDQGIGIPLADQEKLFQAFQRASNAEAIAGTGLGLAITQACVKLHGGDISIDSIENVGTTVTIRLPKGLR
ncbi:response regulator [Leptolyngbya sp. NK1-12]|uniref:histidine kinase n=1 Tax=Leptolyngbya sp. NK1-12 TaxID=2547451 RepID=A0AA96WAV0_9CYAN|nr:response regulator [Leptolyngbya sp. NK1-12]